MKDCTEITRGPVKSTVSTQNLFVQEKISAEDALKYIGNKITVVDTVRGISYQRPANDILYMQQIITIIKS